MRFYLAVALSCACVMALQILQSRLFSVVTWYHLSFLTVSIAMFGLTLGAIAVYRGEKEEQERNLPTILRATSRSFGLSILAALAIQVAVPIIHTNLKTVIFTLPLVAAATTLAYYHAGKLVSLCLTRSGRSAGKVYAADMIGASAGCLAALALMETIDTPSAVIMITAIALANGFIFSPARDMKLLLLTVAIACTGIVNASLPKPVIYPFWTKGVFLTQDNLNFERWNAISRVTVSPAISNMPVFLWGPSPRLPQLPPMDYQYLAVDGAAGTPIMKFDGENMDDLQALEYDVTNIAHFIPGMKSMAIVGVGGGRDLLAALYFGMDRVVALDVNSTQVDLLTRIPEFRSYSNLWNHPGVNIVNSEARSWFSRNSEKFDAVQIALVDTWVSAASGTFALTENSLYTVDAWKLFIGSLNPGGVLTVSRWHYLDSYHDIGRLGAMTAAALFEMGSKEPWKHVFIAWSGHVATAIVGRDPLTDQQLDALHAAAEKFGYAIVFSARMDKKDDLLYDILHSGSEQDINRIIRDIPYDLSPPTDLRPFFFNQTRIGHPLQVIKQALSSPVEVQNLKGHAVATVNLYLILLLALVASALVLVLPFRKALDSAPALFIRAGTAYFFLIGLGFMFVEISLMQIMSLYLGHPIYGLGVVLFSLILSTGIGSFISETLVLDRPRRMTIWVLLSAVYIAIMALSISRLLNGFIGLELCGRIALCVALISPAGLLMGFAFPAGMRLTEKVSARLTPWFWGVNGAAGVTASALAIALSIGSGLDVTLLAGALCYGLLAFPALILLRHTEPASHENKTDPAYRK